MCADLVLLRELDPSIASIADIQATVVAAAHGSNVDTVIVDGEIVKRAGAFPGIERNAIGAALPRARRAVVRRRKRGRLNGIHRPPVPAFSRRDEMTTRLK